MTTPSSKKGRADQRADTPRTVSALGDAIYLLRAIHDPCSVTGCLDCKEILRLERVAAAEPADAEPLDPLGVEIRDWRAAQPPRGSLPERRGERHSYTALCEPIGDEFDDPYCYCDQATHKALAGGSLTATEPPLDGSGYYGEHTYRAGSPRGVTPALDVELLHAAIVSWPFSWQSDPMHMARWVADEYARLGSPEDSDATSR